MIAQGVVIDTATGIIIVTALVGAITFLFKLLLDAKDKEHTRAMLELDSIKKSYQEIAAEALKSATETANYYRNKEGKSPIIPLAAVISESHSPSTAAQRETAAIQTMRAAMAKIKIVTDQEPRQEPPHAVESGSSVSVSLLEAMNLKEQIARVPEITAKKVVDKIKESDHA